MGIIDTFAAMREMTESKLEDMKTTCFICNIDRYTFDRGGTPFDIHIKKEHNMWKYLFYLVYLKTKDETEFSGLESYVAEMIEAEDMAFYPSNKAMCREADDEESDPFQLETTAKFDKYLTEMASLRNQLAEIQGD